MAGVCGMRVAEFTMLMLEESRSSNRYLGQLGTGHRLHTVDPLRACFRQGLQCLHFLSRLSVVRWGGDVAIISGPQNLGNEESLLGQPSIYFHSHGEKLFSQVIHANAVN